MPRPRPNRTTRWLPLLALLLTLGACSRLDLAYRNLDWLIPWSIADYVSLDKSQRTWLEPRIQAHLRWHCSTQLPRYAAWLQEVERLGQADHLDADALLGHMQGFKEAVDAVAVEITPTTVTLLQGLDARQVEELNASLDEKEQKLRKEHLIPRDEQVEQRRERMEKRLKPWFGTLSAQQQAKVDAWAESLGDSNLLWVDNRKLWQSALRSALAERDSQDFAPRIAALLQDRETFWSDAYRAHFERGQVALSQLLADLFNASSASQRERLRSRLHDLQQDIRQLQCPTA
ncbi:hypothetical protein HNP29_000720 [Pseudomonas alcaligenes]|nr:hypothetical protein [Pseudomonas alcaligenes]